MADPDRHDALRNWGADGDGADGSDGRDDAAGGREIHRSAEWRDDAVVYRHAAHWLRVYGMVYVGNLHCGRVFYGRCALPAVVLISMKLPISNVQAQEKETPVGVEAAVEA